MLQNAYFLAKIGADTAENEQHVAEILLVVGEDIREAHALRPPDRARHVDRHPSTSPASLDLDERGPTER